MKTSRSCSPTPTNATIASDTATGTILNDDASVAIDDVTVLEGHLGPSTMTFTVSLSAESALPVSVNFASADGSAIAGSDYTALTPGTLQFAPGETTKTITVEVLGDTVVEPGIETFSVLLSGGVNVVIDHATGTGTILDDDVLLTGKRKATFTDVDGELVTIKVSKGALKVEDFTIVPTGSGSQLALVDFSGDSEFAGTNLSIKSKRVAKMGDRVVDVGAIDASGIDLGKVSIKGDLGQIDAGSGGEKKPAVKSLKAGSLGARGLETQLPGGFMQSDIIGALKKLQLSEGMHDAGLHVSSEISSITIKGDVSGSTLRSDSAMGTVKVSGNWTASNLAAGVEAGDDGFFGTDDDALIAGASAIIARIASITIKGAASGTSDDATDHFGFVAAQIDAFKSAGIKMTLSRGPSNDLAGLLVGANDDLRVREVG